MFDLSNMSPQARAMLSLGGHLGAASAPTRMPVGLGGRIGPAMLGFGQDMDQQMQLALAKKMKEKQLEQAEMQINEMKRIQDLRKKAMEVFEKEQSISSVTTPSTGLGGFSPTANTQPGIGGPTPAQLIQAENYYRTAGLPEVADNYKSMRESMFPDPNKAFYVDPNTGQQMPNQAYQQFALDRGRASAPTVSYGQPQIWTDPQTGQGYVVQAPNRAGEQMQIHTMPSNLAAPDSPAAVAAKKKAELEAKQQVEAEINKPKVMEQARMTLSDIGNVVEVIDVAVGAISPTTAGAIGGASMNVWGTPAFNLAKDLETIRSNLGLDRLQQMRAASETGASGLGQLAIRELTALESRVKSLDQRQSPGKLKENVKAIKRHYQNWEKATKRAIEEKYGPVDWEALMSGGSDDQENTTSTTPTSGAIIRYDEQGNRIP